MAKINIRKDAGTHTVNISDAAGCKTSAAITIAPPPPLKVTPNIFNTTCLNTEDGKVELKISGGTGEYNINWSTGASSQEITNLIAGTYTTVVTDENNCLVNLSAEVEAGSAMEVSVITIDASCYGVPDGTAMIQADKGIAPYNYKWSNGATEADLFDLAAGTYYVTINDNNSNCIWTAGCMYSSIPFWKTLCYPVQGCDRRPSRRAVM